MHTGNQEEANKKVFIYEQDKGWKEDITSIPPVPWPDDLCHWYLSASGDDNYLIMADESKLLIFDGHQWQQRDGPERDMRILTHCGILYLIIRANHGGSFYKVSVQSLLTENDYDWEMIKLPYASGIEYSSLTLVGDHVTMVASIYSGLGMSRTRCVLSLSSISNSWIELTQLNLDRYDIRSIVGCPNGTLFFMGLMEMKDPRSHNLSSAAALRQLNFPDQQATILQFKMMKLAPNGMLPREEGEYILLQYLMVYSHCIITLYRGHDVRNENKYKKCGNAENKSWSDRDGKLILPGDIQYYIII